VDKVHTIGQKIEDLGFIFFHLLDLCSLELQLFVNLQFFVKRHVRNKDRVFQFVPDNFDSSNRSLSLENACWSKGPSSSDALNTPKEVCCRDDVVFFLRLESDDDVSESDHLDVVGAEHHGLALQQVLEDVADLRHHDGQVEVCEVLFDDVDVGLLVQEAREQQHLEVFGADVDCVLGDLVEVEACVVAELHAEGAEDLVVAVLHEVLAEEDVVSDRLADQNVHLLGVEVGDGPAHRHRPFVDVVLAEQRGDEAADDGFVGVLEYAHLLAGPDVRRK
jgi:hypothetical protein